MIVGTSYSKGMRDTLVLVSEPKQLDCYKVGGGFGAINEHPELKIQTWLHSS